MVKLWETIQKIRVSAYRQKVLNALSECIKTPRELEKQLDIQISHISRALKELTKLDLAKCLTPNIGRNRIYSITPKGKKILKKIEKNGKIVISYNKHNQSMSS